ncbi:methyltransferase domain-containing protein [Mycobacterium sp. 050134]|uniref:methyltransferase domain-containing protein n=1 Tax=Mycobacterium sp. 050134 TaxID=3096111 RepID=UPI002EDAF207
MGLKTGCRAVGLRCGGRGPIAYAVRERSVRPVLAEPEAGACRAAKRLFGYPVMRADAAALPLADASCDAAWTLGVLCTTPDQSGLLGEPRRVVRPGGPIGLLAFVIHRDIPCDELPENHFPTPDRLRELVHNSSLHVEHRLGTADLPGVSAGWDERMDAVTGALAVRYGDTRAWQLAEEQSSKIGELLENGTLTGELLVLRHA